MRAVNITIAITYIHYISYPYKTPIPVAARFKEWVCGRSLAGIAGSNPAGGMDACLLWVLYVCQAEASATGRSLV
jgi:hypothetical protein